MGDKIYNLFVEYAEAPESWRENFVSWFENGHKGNEYRFSSNIGPGSKIYTTRDSWYVDYYQEFKKTSDQIAAKKAINEKLVALHKEHYK